LKSFPLRPDWAPDPSRFAGLVWPYIENLAPRVMIQSFDFPTLHAMRRLAPALPLGALFEGGEGDFAAVARSAQADIAAPEFSLVTAPRVAAAHAAGIRVYTWTVNRPRDWRRMIEAGVDAIITDDPAGLIRYLADG
jgi:glycerophosphoryl diester phosphodiesterase